MPPLGLGHGGKEGQPAGDYRCYKDYLAFVLDAWKSELAGTLVRLYFTYNESAPHLIL